MAPSGDSDRKGATDEEDDKYIEVDDHQFQADCSSSRMPSQWLTRDSLIVPDRKQKEKLKKKMQKSETLKVKLISKSKETIDLISDDEEDSTEDLLDDSEEENTDQSEVMSSSFGSGLEDISTQVRQLEQQNLVQRQMSFLLREFYTNFEARNKRSNASQNIASYHPEIVLANKCLLVAGQFIIIFNLI